MLKIRNVLIVPLFTVLSMFMYSAAPAAVQVGIGIGLPNVSIGINFPAYPELVVVPGYPVYYAPRLSANFFFYDGLYWVYQDDNWYESSWYNGPWWLIEPEYVPVFILRVPVRYYRQPPMYFGGWQSNMPPRWGDHWGHDWEQHRGGWDRWDHRSAPAPAPLPTYQRRYSGDRYPQQVEQQRELHQQNYRYQPRDPVVRQQYQEQTGQKAPAQHGKFQQDRQQGPEDKGSKQQERRTDQRLQSPQRDGGDAQRSMSPSQQQGRPEAQERRQPPALDQREQQMPRSQQEHRTEQRLQSPQRDGGDAQRSMPPSPQQGRPEAQDRRQQSQSVQGQQEQAQREQQMARPQARPERQQGKDSKNEPKSGQGQEQDRGRGHDRNE
jgi:hypothetical protein